MSKSNKFYLNKLAKSKLIYLLVLYILILGIDPVRKIISPSNIFLIAIYIWTVVVYYITLRKDALTGSVITGSPLIAIFLLFAWLIFVWVITSTPNIIAITGLQSYLFFVPYFYVGQKVLGNDYNLTIWLKVQSYCGALIGIGAIISEVFRSSAPKILQPIIPQVANHSAGLGSIYLPSSIFADGEKAAEMLLISLFALIAYNAKCPRSSLLNGRLLLGLLILGGIIATSTRTDIFLALIAIGMLFLVGKYNSLKYRIEKSNIRPYLIAMILIGLFCIVAIASVSGGSKFYNFLNATNQTSSRLQLMFFLPSQIPFVGQGPGTSTQGISNTGTQSLPLQGEPTYNYEGHTYITGEGAITKVWLEIGIVGLIIYVFLFWTIFSPLILKFKYVDNIGKSFIVGCICLGILFLKGHASLDDPFIQPLFWLNAGVATTRMNFCQRGNYKSNIYTP